MRKLLAALPILFLLLCAGTAHAAYSQPCSGSGSQSNSTVLTVTFSASCSTSAGDAIFVAYYSGNGRTPTTVTDGSTQTYALQGQLCTVNGVCGYSTTNSTSGVTQVLITPNGFDNIIVIAWTGRGLATSSLLDTSAAGASSFCSTTCTASAVTTTNASDIIYVELQTLNVAGMNSITPGSGYTFIKEQDSAFAAGAIGLNVMGLTALTSGTGTFTPGYAAPVGQAAPNQTFAFKAAGGGGGVKRLRGSVVSR